MLSHYTPTWRLLWRQLTSVSTPTYVHLSRGGEDIAAAVAFAHDVWSLSGHKSWNTKAGIQTSLDFSDVPFRWRTAVKEWILLCLDPSLATTWAPNDPIATTWPERQEPIKLVTAQGNLKALRLAVRGTDRYDLVEPDADGWTRATSLTRQPQDREEGRRLRAALSPGDLAYARTNVAVALDDSHDCRPTDDARRPPVRR